jgi:hypothetical protein
VPSSLRAPVPNGLRLGPIVPMSHHTLLLTVKLVATYLAPRQNQLFGQPGAAGRTPPTQVACDGVELSHWAPQHCRRGLSKVLVAGGGGGVDGCHESWVGLHDSHGMTGSRAAAGQHP